MLDPYERSAVVYDLYYSWLDYEAHAGTVRRLLEERIPEAVDLLELGCGTGRYLEQMAKWYNVEGLDISESMLTVARSAVPKTTLHVGDMTDFDLGRTFDALICMFSSVAYVTSLDSLRSMIRCCAKHLNPGGVLIVEPWFAPDRWNQGHIGSRVVEGDGLVVARIDTSIREGNLVDMRWAWAVASEDGTADAYVEEHSTALFSVAEYADVFQAAGFAHEYDPEGPLARGLHIGLRE